MANTQRYKPVPPWVVADTITGRTGAVATIEVADLKERHTGRVYINGAQRVSFRMGQRDVRKPRQKPFYGEMAWSESRNYAETELNKLWREQLDRP